MGKYIKTSNRIKPNDLNLYDIVNIASKSHAVQMAYSRKKFSYQIFIIQSFKSFTISKALSSSPNFVMLKSYFVGGIKSLFVSSYSDLSIVSIHIILSGKKSDLYSGKGQTNEEILNVLFPED